MTLPQPPVVALRPATATDFDHISALFAALHGFNAALDARFILAANWHQSLHAQFRQSWDAPEALWLLAWADAVPVGLLMLAEHHDPPLFHERCWVELVALYVAPTRRRGGLAYRLLEAARAWTAARGLDRLQLYVTASNATAKAFYQRCGLVPVQEIWRLEVTPTATTPHPVAPALQANSASPPERPHP
ncbi:MAG: GNAT family N-acetyltransferase [Ktedonobacterales bacterium]|nr:GNAT family N-acetyltransferase [Ktedonobacterales bacterium]